MISHTQDVYTERELVTRILSRIPPLSPLPKKNKHAGESETLAWRVSVKGLLV